MCCKTVLSVAGKECASDLPKEVLLLCKQFERCGKYRTYGTSTHLDSDVLSVRLIASPWDLF